MAKVYDVLICGGGLAGLTLARQLRLELPALSVAVVDRLKRPLPEAAHVIKCRLQTERFRLNGRWLIDALGRRRLLQTKLGLTRPNGHAASAAWWCVDARLDVTEMGDKQNRQWRQRMVEARYLSTVHFMGRGYWVWLIPLASGATSVGIVTDETIHPVSSYGKSHADAARPNLWR
jgi:flavin-dependent dehydrogenase